MKQILLKMKKQIIYFFLASFMALPMAYGMYADPNIDPNNKPNQNEGMSWLAKGACFSLLSSPLAYVLYNRYYAAPTKYLVIDNDEVTIGDTSISWKDVTKIHEKNKYEVEVCAEDDEGICIYASNIAVSAPKLMKILNYYWTEYKIKNGSNEKQPNYPKTVSSPFISTKYKKDENGNSSPIKATFSKPKFGNVALGVGIFLSLLGVCVALDDDDD